MNLDRLVCRAFLLLIAVVSISGALSHAHEDPLGDIRPEVFTTANRFEIYFTTNRPTDTATDRKVYRTTFSAKGELIAEREPFVGTPPEREISIPFQMDNKDGRPSITMTLLGEERPRTIEPQLPPGMYTDCFVIGWLPDWRFAMRDPPAATNQGEESPFSLRIVDLRTGALIDSAVIGIPGRIYMFATTSEVLSTDGEIVIAWMERRRLADEIVILQDGSTANIRQAAFRMIVTRWKPNLQKPLHTVVADAIDDNVSISIGRINSVVLVAWHEWGKIRTRVVDLDAAEFVPQLPELQLDEEKSKKVEREIFGKPLDVK